MNNTSIFYLCPKCFAAFDDEPADHPHAMLRINPAVLDVEARQPVMDQNGNLQSRAPRWFLEAIGTLPFPRPSRSHAGAMPA